eukprot:scaffold7152_cov148-Skeletonema_dohrnii-CCMP3373.AAC.3
MAMAMAMAKMVMGDGGMSGMGMGGSGCLLLLARKTRGGNRQDVAVGSWIWWPPMYSLAKRPHLPANSFAFGPTWIG